MGSGGEVFWQTSPDTFTRFYFLPPPAYLVTAQYCEFLIYLFADAKIQELVFISALFFVIFRKYFNFSEKKTLFKRYCCCFALFNVVRTYVFRWIYQISTLLNCFKTICAWLNVVFKSRVLFAPSDILSVQIH